MSDRPELLCLHDIECSYGGLRSVAGVSLTVRAGETVALIGPNGAGKTTLINAVSGLVTVRSGRIVVAGVDVTHLPSWRRARLGVARSFQMIRLFNGLSVIDNVELGIPREGHPGVVASAFHLPSHGRYRRAVRLRAQEKLTAIGLADKAYAPSSSVSHGQGRRVELARALASQPSLILLDEPTSGLHAGAIRTIVPILRAAAAQGAGILLVEHNLKFVGEVADRVVVLHHGAIIASGAPGQVMRDPQVMEAYLGGAVGISAGSGDRGFNAAPR